MAKTPWVITHSGSMVMECQRCGAKHDPHLPVSLSMWAAMAKEFIKLHAKCSTPAAPDEGKR